MGTDTDMRLGTILIKLGMVTPSFVNAAVRAQVEGYSQDRIGEILIEVEQLTKAQLAQGLNMQKVMRQKQSAKQALLAADAALASRRKRHDTAKQCLSSVVDRAEKLATAFILACTR